MRSRWKPDKPGEVRLTLTVPKTGGERFLDNNSIEAPLAIRKEQLHVLVIESFPRWEYRYLRNALERDPGVERELPAVSSRTRRSAVRAAVISRRFPRTRQLTKYDVVFLGDVGTGQRPAHA